MTDQSVIIDWLHEHGAIRTGHFVYTKGGHWSHYSDMVVALNDVGMALEITDGMVELIRNLEFDTVAGPAHADDKWAFAIAIELRRKYGRFVKFVYAQERTEIVVATVAGEVRNFKVVTDDLSLPRQQRRHVKGRRVLIVCDVMSTGSTVEKMIRLIQAEGGIVVGVVVACGHSGIKQVLGFQVFELLNIPAQMHEPPCPAGAGPIDTDLGHGREYLESQRGGTVS